MTDPTPGQHTGGDADGAHEAADADVLPDTLKRGFFSATSHPADAHSPASPYTFTSIPRPARALPLDEEEPAPASLPVAPVLPATAVPDVAPPAALPHQPVPAEPDPIAALPDPVPAPPDPIPVQPDPVPVLPDPVLAPPDPVWAQEEPIRSILPGDDYVEPPLVPRPYAIPTPIFGPAPSSYSPPSQTFAPLAGPSAPVAEPPQPPAATPPSFVPSGPLPPSSFEELPVTVPPQPSRGEGEALSPFSAPSPGEAPPRTPRPYAQPGYVPYVPAPHFAQDQAPAYASTTEPYPSFGGPTVPAMATGFGSAKPRTERVGRGLLFALIAVIAGCVLAAVVYHFGYVASIIALAMGGAGIFLYSKGAGTAPRKGAAALVVLLLAGILLAWVCSVATELYIYYVDETGSSKGALLFAIQGALSLDLFQATLKDFLIFVAFGALGIFGVARQLLVPRKVK